MPRIVPAILALFLVAPTYSAGISGQSARPYIQSVSNAISVMPQSWQQQVGQFLTSPNFSAAQLHGALNALNDQSPGKSVSMTHIQAVAESEHSQAIGSLTEQSPEVVARKLSELSLILTPYFGTERTQLIEAAKQARTELSEEKRQSLNISLQRTAQALGMSIELTGLALNDTAAIASGEIFPPRKIPKGWQLQAADKKNYFTGPLAAVPSPTVETGSSTQDYYQILGVGRNASAEQIKSAFKKLVKKYHPDSNSGSREHEAKYIAAVEAHAILGDPIRKESYDRGEKPSPRTSDDREYVSADDPFVSRFDLPLASS